MRSDGSISFWDEQAADDPADPPVLFPVRLRVTVETENDLELGVSVRLWRAKLAVEAALFLDPLREPPSPPRLGWSQERVTERGRLQSFAEPFVNRPNLAAALEALRALPDVRSFAY